MPTPILECETIHATFVEINTVLEDLASLFVFMLINFIVDKANGEVSRVSSQSSLTLLRDSI